MPLFCLVFDWCAATAMLIRSMVGDVTLAQSNRLGILSVINFSLPSPLVFLEGIAHLQFLAENRWYLLDKCEKFLETNHQPKHN